MAKKKSTEEIQYDTLRHNTRELLKTRAGQDFVWFVLSICDIYGHHFTGNSTTFFNEGKRFVGLEVLALLEEVDPTAYARLLLNRQEEKEFIND
jgi:hypothetical protein